jgi:phosphotransferase system enzyme I (PtsI)
MSTHLKGAGGAPGIVLGRAFCYAVRDDDPAAGRDERPGDALARFVAAQAAAVERLNMIAEAQRVAGHESEAGIFEFQALLVEDPALSDEVARLIGAGEPLGAALTAAVAAVRTSIAAVDDDYLRERAADVDAVGAEIRRALFGGGPSLASLPAGAIIVAPDLTPAETAELRSGSVAGFATAHGGPTGHTAILARALGIPAAVGLGAAALGIADGAELILDGAAALLIVEPTPEERDTYTARASDESVAGERRRLAFHDKPGRLADGQAVAVWANIGHPDEAANARHHGAEGIGLFRTEFLFLDRKTAPDEEEQFAAYRAVLEIMDGRPVVIRTLDIGGDKPLPYLDLPPEANPFLGVRALRLCMQRPDLFATQLRALLRAAVYGDLWIMLPMVATPADFAWGRAQLQAAAESLAAAGIAHRADARLGIMIETPAAAVTADLLAREAAFFSVGSNDLTQYAMAADRGIGDFGQRYPHDAPAVLRLIAQAAAAAHQAGIPIGVCGNLAGEPEAALLLAGLGIDELSMAPGAIPLVKEHLLSVSQAQAQAMARAAMGLAQLK